MSVDFKKMREHELSSTIETILSVRHQFDSFGALASAGRAESQKQVWADRYVDQLQRDLREACRCYVALDLRDHDERLTRALIVAGAYSWIPNPTLAMRNVIRPLFDGQP